MPIQSGLYRIAAHLKITDVAGKASFLPIYSFNLDLNGFNLATQFEVRCPINPFDGGLTYNAKKVVDHPRQLQLACDKNLIYKADLYLSYESISPNSTQVPPRFQLLENGMVDEIHLDLMANEQTFICRTAGARLQEVRIQGAVDKFQYGHQLVSKAMKLYAPEIAMTLIPSRYPAGHSFTEFDYTKSPRGHSIWDYISQTAQDDGYILTIHNNQGYYGPPGQFPGAPTLKYAWGRDLTNCTVQHAARRSRNVQVIVTGYNQQKQNRILAQYPPGSSLTVTEKVYIDVKANHTKASLIDFAKNQYQELISKEFVVTADLIPDTFLVNTLSKFGSHFYCKFDGILPSINAPLYHVKQAHVTLSGGDSEPNVTVQITAENHASSING